MSSQPVESEALDRSAPQPTAAVEAKASTIESDRATDEVVSRDNDVVVEVAGSDVGVPATSAQGNEEEDEEEECAFCLFMKGGGCKESFVEWEKCVEEAEKTGEDVVEKCFQVTSLLKKCMDAHADYYEPILRAEQAMAESIVVEPALSVDITEGLSEESSKN